MKYIDAEKLSAEIERLKDKYPSWQLRLAMDDLCEFITSLQREHPEVDLEKEINLCWINWLSPSNQKEVEGVLPKTEFEMYARHFYELGLNARKKE